MDYDLIYYYLCVACLSSLVFCNCLAVQISVTVVCSYIVNLGSHWGTEVAAGWVRASHQVRENISEVRKYRIGILKSYCRPGYSNERNG